MKKFVNIEIDNEENIGVIDLGEIDLHASGVEDEIKEIIELKLNTALEEHFDCSVKILLTEVHSTIGHIHVTSTVVLYCGEDEEHEETVEMAETWIY